MIYELAGLCGVDPAGFTLRELQWMSEARRHHDWGQTSSLIAAIYEVNRDRRRRRRPFQPSEFNPLLRAAAAPVPITVSQLSDLLAAANCHVRTNERDSQ